MVATQRHRTERMFLNSRRMNVSKIAKSGITEVATIDRKFDFMTREMGIGIRPEASFCYNMFLGEGGDDELSRIQALETFSTLYSDVSTVTFAVPSVGTIIEHLKRYDAPDMPINEDALLYLCEALEHVKSNEWSSRRKIWQDLEVLGLSDESLPSFPGIVMRSKGFATKEQAEVSGMIEAYVAFSKMSNNIPVVGRPCALFGRGKRKKGIETAGRIGRFHAGRLVMACDTRDHCILNTVAQEMKCRRRAIWKTTEMMQGTSFQNRGSSVFLYNIVCDLRKQGFSRMNHLEIQPWAAFDKVDFELKLFSMEEQFKYRYFVLDLSRQDSSISSELIDHFFEFARSLWHVPKGKNRKRNFGRWMRWMREYTVHTRFALPDGQVWQKHKGNVTGSPLTTDINTYTALLAVRTVLGVLLGAGRQDEVVCRVYGDNILAIVPKAGTGAWGLDEIVEAWSSIFDQKVNPDESYECSSLIHEPDMDAQESASFLSRHFMVDGAVWRPTMDTVCSMIAPDSEDKSDGARFARAVGLMCDNPFDPESTLFLNRVLDDLERRGVHSGSLPSREAVKMKYKLQAEEALDVCRRMTVLECQALYLYTPLLRTQLGITLTERHLSELESFHLEFISPALTEKESLLDAASYSTPAAFEWLDSPFMRAGLFQDLEQGWRPEVFDYSMLEPDLVASG